MKKTAVIAVLAAGSVSAARAQVPRVFPVPGPGELIRVTPSSGAPYTGRLAAMGGDTLYVRPSPGDSLMMAIASRERVEVSRSHRERWSGLGALAGVAAGVIAAQLQSPSGNASLKRTETAVVGGAAGAVLGGLIGFVSAPPRWQLLRARLPRHAPANLPPPASADSSAAPPPAPADSSAAPPPAPAPTPVDPAAVPQSTAPAQPPAPVSPPSAPPPSHD